MHTPTAVRDATSEAPTIIDDRGEDLELDEEGSPGPRLVQDREDASENVHIEVSRRTAASPDSPLGRAREKLRRGIDVVQKGVDTKSVQYLFRAARDAMKKRAEIARLRKQVVTMQQKLDGVLGQLGREARAADIQIPALADEMHATKSLEQERQSAQGHIGALEQERAAQEERHRTATQEQDSAVATSDAQAKKLGEQLAIRTNERAAQRAGLNRIDTQLKALSRQISANEAAALKSAEPTQQATLRGEIEALRVQTAALEPERERFERKAAELEAPIVELEQKLGEARQEAARLRQQLAELHAKHGETLARISSQVGEQTQRIANTNRELSSKFATLGTILNLNRVMSPALDPLYQEFDEIRRGASESEARIVKLEADIQGFDRARLQKGVMVLVGGVLVLILLIAVVAIIV